MAHLIVQEPGGVAISLPVHDGFHIGREAGNDLSLSDPKVSRRHARLVADGDRHAIEDLGATHGVFVNGKRIERALLASGDRVQVGATLLTYAERGGEETVMREPTAAAADPPARADSRLRLLFALAGAVDAAHDADELCARALDGLLETLGCEGGLCGLIEGTPDRLRRVARRRGGDGEIVMSRTLLDALLVAQESVLVRGDGAALPATLARAGVRTAAGVPLRAGGRLFGFVFVEARDRRADLDAADLAFLTAAAHLVAAALDVRERADRADRCAEALAAAREGSLVGESEPMRRLRASVDKVAAAAGTDVLILGETGTGKELVARTVHEASPRAKGPFLAVNCAAIPDTIIESELFGHERGAFTGAVRSQRGKFLVADGGTLFLDEIGELSPAAQAKLLRALEEKEIQPVGAERTRRVDVRVVAATHRDLRAEVQGGRFREDLYYRVAVVEIVVPPLRERGSDVELLAHLFLQRAAPRVGKRLDGFTAAALGALRRHGWPGNVRELANEVERAAIHAEGRTIDAADLSPRLRAAPEPVERAGEGTLAERWAALEPAERALVEEAVAAARGNVSEAARLLGISRIVMKRRLERFGIGS